ncbi:eukaryotic phosphomannomutase domain-containing protein [Ditylenchus destructor]|nr:eukaryotic phosphomannomutase domain-containing protein [Ditylenchus destructor]
MREIYLFDMDGTLTPSRNVITPEMWNFLQKLKGKVSLGIVGGSNFEKIVEQMGGDKELLLSSFDYVFSENGLISYKGHEQLPAESIIQSLGEEKLQDVIDFCLHYISTVRLPVKRGIFVELRKGMMNVSPIGRSCSQAERNQFVEYEAKEPVRKTFVNALRERFHDYNLTFSIGGQISIDIFPTGWDKTYCLRYLQPHYDAIHFFGDKTAPGGNDFEIFEHPATIGHTVLSPDHTRQVVEELTK